MRWLPPALATIIFCGAACAEEPITRFAPIIANQTGGLIFQYVAPVDGFIESGPMAPQVQDSALAAALRAGGVDPTTGIDFGAVRGVLTLGEPPNTLNVLIGEAGFAAETPNVLLDRGYETREVAGTNVYASGEDNAQNLRERGNPLGGGLGKAQRVVILEVHLAVASNWATIEGFLEPRASGLAPVWTASLDALESLSGDNQLETVVGFGAEVFLGQRLDPALMLNGDINAIREAMEGEPELRFPPFPFALFAMEHGSAGSNLRIALPYVDLESAAAAAAHVTSELETLSGTAALSSELIEDNDLVVAIISIAFPAEDAADAQVTLQRWLGAVMQRQFAPLTFAIP
ncbi:MAG: hypothetical protein GX970_04885 [Phyllobacteriaceae bacterium]|nr:hypothetical protein [Phyllobacteriaceae bacterium]